MKRSRFTEEQIIGVLREQEAGMKVAEVCRKHGVSEPTSKFGGMSVSDAKRLKQLEEENAKLKKLLAEAMLDVAVLKDITSRKWCRDRQCAAAPDKGLREALEKLGVSVPASSAYSPDAPS
jgi:putative transposase